MSRNKTLQPVPTRPTYHLADRLAGLATDSLYKFTEGHHTLAPVEHLVITALVTAHRWGYSSQVCAVDGRGRLHAAGEATAAHPLPTGITSRIRTFTSGPLTWHHTAARITDDQAPHVLTTPTLYVAAGQHHYEIRQDVTFDTRTNTTRTYCHLSIDGRRHETPFAGVVGATDFVVNEYES
ncbi:hypothetical protein [Mycobacterium avium]|uniref:hypothetical protein n=1 Tax=Mycobacterium avium TaxID=1764 RepID=UPI00114F354F|nr:hypothetical protein [Mycobacterium avium]MBZ4612379.1 hypothetical protein [Mycobacterium avium subsp. hominissuis]